MKNQITKSIIAICMMLCTQWLPAQTVEISRPEKIIGCEEVPASLLAPNGKLAHANNPMYYNSTTIGNKMDLTPKLDWPLKMSDEYKDLSGVYSYFYISNYLDLDPDTTVKEDWYCFTNDYARNYEGHNGADICPYPYGWQMMDDESVDVIAAADGVIGAIFDGNTFDRNCSKPHTFIINDTLDNTGYLGNYVRIDHAGGLTTLYGHLKHGTLTDLNVGDSVKSGDYLGKIGSSGNSTGPHLHFQVMWYGSLVEPWKGNEDVGEPNCNFTYYQSLWNNQIPYYNTQLIRVATHFGAPTETSCTNYEAGSNETETLVNHFSSFQIAKIGVSIRNIFAGMPINVDIFTSTGVLKNSMSYTPLVFDEIATYYFDQSLLSYATGTYRVRVTFDGKTYDHYFTVNCSGDLIYSAAQSGHKGFISGGSITSTSTISGTSANEILYEAETFVKLNVGFQAAMNCEFKARLDDCTLGGVKEEPEPIKSSDSRLTVYPNPTFGEFSLLYEGTSENDALVNIFDLTGRLITQYTFSSNQGNVNHTFDLSEQAKGLYLIEVRQGDNVSTSQLIIQ